MSDRLRTDLPDQPDPIPDVVRQLPTLPEFLARRLLRPDEVVTWVRGPRSNPSLEPFLTHPGLFVVAIVLGGILILTGSVAAKVQPEALPISVLIAGGLALASIYVLAISAAYFTRLVVTSERVFIVQGYELCKTWRLDDLPPSLIRHGKGKFGERTRAVDLEKFESLFGATSDKFVDAKAILKFGKQLDNIRRREEDRF